MKRATYTLIFFFIYTLFSCKTKEDAVGMNNILVYENVYQKIQLSELIEDVKYVELESKPTSMIGNIVNIKFTDSLIYIHNVNGMASNSLLCFDRNGKFIRNVFQKGNARNEVMRMKGFDVTKDYVIVCDNDRQRMLYFSHSGKFIKYKQLAFYISDFFAINNDILSIEITPVNPYFKSKNNYRVITIDENLKIIDSIGYYNSSIEKVALSRMPYFSGRIFTIPYENSCYRFNDEGKIDTAYNFDLGDKALSSFVIEKQRNSDDMQPYILSECVKNNKVVIYYSPIESDKLLTVKVTDYSQEYKTLLFYDKEDNIPYLINSVVNNIDNALILDITPKTYDKYSNRFVLSQKKISKDDLIQNGAIAAYDQLSEYAKKMLIGDDVDSNPILVFVKFKKPSKAKLEKYKINSTN